MTITEKIREYINESFLTETEGATVRDEDDLLTILDSLQILRMVMDLESEYSIKVENSDLTPENLGSVAKLAEFIDRKRQGSQRQKSRQKSSCSTAAN